MDTSELLKKLAESKVYDLEQTRFAGMPAFSAAKPSFAYIVHRHHVNGYDPTQHGSRSSATGAIIASDHFGTHVDALCHQADEMKLFGGIDATPAVDTPEGFTQLGAEVIAPLIAQGFLLDVARYLGTDVLPDAYAITAQDLIGCAAAQGVEIAPGGVVLVRTGSGQFWNDATRYLKCAGLGPDANRWVLEQEPYAVGADNLTWDLLGIRDAETGASFFGHLLLLARNGIYMFENLNLEELAKDRVNHFLFIATPLKLKGATGSPVRPIAIEL